MKKNIVSILCPSYNHERFVGFFINSLLQQTNPNWELIIVDDCSTDNNVAEIKKFSDKRIKLIQNPFNMGINCGLNKAFEISSGQYISFCASDDMLCSDYVQNVFDLFEQNPDKSLLYCDLQIIDNDNKPLERCFYNPCESRYKVLHKLFMCGNWPLSPGMVAKRDLFEKIMPLDIPLSMYQDYKMHIDLLLLSDFMVMSKKSVLYRKATDQSGLSGSNEVNPIRQQLEENLLMDSFLKIKDPVVLRKIFNEELINYETIDKRTIPFVLGMLAMKSSERFKRVWGFNQISKFINSQDNYTLVHKVYGFSYKDFLGLARLVGEDLMTQKYRKYKKLFNVMAVISAVLFILCVTLVI